MSERRVVVTGLGAINAAGNTATAFHDSITGGRCSLGAITRFDAADFPVRVAGEVSGFRAEDFVPKRLLVKSDRFTHFALTASAMALDDARLDIAREDKTRMGVWFGNDTGGWDLAERGFVELHQQGARMVNPWGATAWFPTAPQGFTTIRYGITGVSKSFVCDRASGAAALYFAWRAIRTGMVDAVLAGGTEAPITGLGMTCYFETGELSTSRDPQGAYRPFDSASSGLVMGEGSAVLVLEEESRARARGAPIYGEILGGSMTSDPSPGKRMGGARAMRQALERANVSPRAIDLLFAEGAASKTDDAIEVSSIADVFGEDGPHVTCPKGAYGHLFGASAATEAVSGFLAMKTGRIPPVIGLRDPAGDHGVRFVREPAEHRVSTFMVNARGREGVNVSLVMGQRDA